MPRLTLRDLTGKVLAVETIVDGRATFSVGQFAAGMYFATYSGRNATEVIKVNKQ